MTEEEQTEMFNTYYMAGYPSRKASATSKPTYAELEKENAELKENYRKRGDIITSLERQLRLNIHSNNLTKAKEIIKEFVEWANWQGSNCPSFKSIQDKAEQFLKEVCLTEEQRSTLKYYDKIFIKE